MAYRVSQVATVKYGHFGDYVKTLKRLVARVEENGWAPMRVLVPTAGPNNEVVLQQWYDDLATFQSENDAFYKDEAAFKAFRDGAKFVVEGSARTEIYEDVMLVGFPGSD
jgi:hypothetical protein